MRKGQKRGGALKCVEFRTLITEDAGRKGQWRMLKWDRRMSVVEVMEVFFVEGLLGEKEESDEDGDFWVSFVIF